MFRYGVTGLMSQHPDIRGRQQSSRKTKMPLADAAETNNEDASDRQSITSLGICS